MALDIIIILHKSFNKELCIITFQKFGTDVIYRRASVLPLTRRPSHQFRC